MKREQLWCIHSDATLCSFPDCGCPPRDDYYTTQLKQLQDEVEQIVTKAVAAERERLAALDDEITRLRALLQSVETIIPLGMQDSNIAKAVRAAIRKDKPDLQRATTRELLDELHVRGLCKDEGVK